MKNYETSNVKYMDKICLNYDILRNEIWNMNHEIILKDEISALILLFLKFRRQFLLITYPLHYLN